MKVLVTGGAGFIGSHLVDALMEHGDEVVVVDNLSSGSLANLQKWQASRGFQFRNGDLKDPASLPRALDGVGIVYHFAANPEVRVGATDPSVHFEENLLVTFRLLEAMRESPNAKTMVFASTSTVYGDAHRLPTPEGYGPLLPISTYGASKLGSEALLASYAHTHSMRGLILRFGNVVGSRAKLGVLVDFIAKLKANLGSLEILGDGTQTKSYVHVKDCIAAIILAKDHFLENQEPVDAYNVSSPDQISVKRIAELVSELMGLHNVKMRFTSGVDGGRGWKGDVKHMQLSIKKLQDIGWNPQLNSEEAVRKAVKELLT